jgi:hypothetical protein
LLNNPHDFAFILHKIILLSSKTTLYTKQLR